MIPHFRAIFTLVSTASEPELWNFSISSSQDITTKSKKEPMSKMDILYAERHVQLQ